MAESKPVREHFDNLDGLRAISCICIIAMHIRANADYQIGGWFFNRFVPSWTQFVPLFLMISGFGMFCGYYNAFRNKSVDLDSFYLKRYKKLLPFFTVLIVIGVVMEHSVAGLIEGLTEATLAFGLLPNNQLSVIGVSWTLGVIFLFYMLFPFFVFLCADRRRALFSLGISIMLSMFCSAYFFSERFVPADYAERHNFLYCTPFFLGGGITYLFRHSIQKWVSKCRWICLAACIALTATWFFVPTEICGINILMLKNLILFLPWLWYAISVKSWVLSNKVMKYLSGISLELYLAQMIVFRVLEKLHGLYLFGIGWLSFLFAWAAVVAGLILFIICYRKASELIMRKLSVNN